jgi:hypothetical protein
MLSAQVGWAKCARTDAAHTVHDLSVAGPVKQSQKIVHNGAIAESKGIELARVAVRTSLTKSYSLRTVSSRRTRTGQLDQWTGRVTEIEESTIGLSVAHNSRDFLHHAYSGR